jgi:hypothetical protein
MHVENTISIEQPIEELFEYVSTPENDPTWVSVSIRNQRTSPGPMRESCTCEVRRINLLRGWVNRAIASLQARHLRPAWVATTKRRGLAASSPIPRSPGRR